MYLRAAKAAGMNDAEMKAVVDHLSMAPDDGALMEGTGGARKLRAAGRGKGKSGGYWIVTYYCGKDVPVFLLIRHLQQGGQSEPHQSRAEHAQGDPRRSCQCLAGERASEGPRTQEKRS